jgi:hypothetical protein
VQVLGISEEVFWHADISTIERIVENKTAYDSWMSSVIAREKERNGRQK